MLVTMRLTDMHRVHPEQDNTHVCARCGETVGIYPSGQAVLRADPDIEIICNRCILSMSERTATSVLMVMAPGALEDAAQSVPAPSAAPLHSSKKPA